MGQGSGSAHRLTSTERLELQQRVRAGETHGEAGISVGCSAKSVQRLLRKTGGVKPRKKPQSALRLSLPEREDFPRTPGRRLLSSDRDAIGAFAVDRIARCCRGRGTGAVSRVAGRCQGGPTSTPAKDAEAGCMSPPPRGGRAWTQAPVVAATDRRAIGSRLSRRLGDARVA